MEGLLTIVKMGVYASIQDRGRIGYRRFGVPSSGPMDRQAHFYGNYILNNDKNAPSLELFIGGFLFEALQQYTYVITGASAECYVNNKRIPMWQAFELNKGDRLEVRTITAGSVVYLSTVGGFANELILGSRSSYDLAGIGTTCKEGTLLQALNRSKHVSKKGLYAPYIPRLTSSKIRVFKGPHYELFDDSSKAILLEPFQFVGGNRMGYYLQGRPLQTIGNEDILSEATQFGTIQVMSNGQPVVLMADGQTVGGYPIIATVLKEDLPQLVQKKMYDFLQFEIVEGLNGY